MTPEAPMVAEIQKAPRTALLEAWAGLFEGPPPPHASVRLLRLMMADEIQWRASGRSRPALMRRLAKLAGDAPSDGKPRIKSGTRLVREWHGRKYIVEITASGFEWRGKTWASLSAIAREITGTRWSGPRFFGVRT